MTELKHKFTETIHPKLRRPIYPNGRSVDEDGIMGDDYYDFSCGLDATDEWINKYIDQGLKYFENNLDENYWRVSYSSGNTSIIILKYWDEDAKFPNYNIIVSKNHMEAFVNGNENL
tara:strand:- start:309 stop:659 length:351 start_codon:yes stop_codon:yes gene_type:complete